MCANRMVGQADVSVSIKARAWPRGEKPGAGGSSKEIKRDGGVITENGACRPSYARIIYRLHDGRGSEKLALAVAGSGVEAAGGVRGRKYS